MGRSAKLLLRGKCCAGRRFCGTEFHAWQRYSASGHRNPARGHDPNHSGFHFAEWNVSQCNHTRIHVAQWNTGFDNTWINFAQCNARFDSRWHAGFHYARVDLAKRHAEHDGSGIDFSQRHNHYAGFDVAQRHSEHNQPRLHFASNDASREYAALDDAAQLEFFDFKQ